MSDLDREKQEAERDGPLAQHMEVNGVCLRLEDYEPGRWVRFETNEKFSLWGLVIGLAFWAIVACFLVAWIYLLYVTGGLPLVLACVIGSIVPPFIIVPLING